MIIYQPAIRTFEIPIHTYTAAHRHDFAAITNTHRFTVGITYSHMHTKHVDTLLSFRVHVFVCV